MDAADLSPRIRMHAFADGAALARALAAAVAADLAAALAAGRLASLAVSGGNTPRAFLQALATQALDWPRVVVTLVDERWVPESSARSNAALVRQHLLQGPAAAVRFVPLYRPAARPEDAVGEVENDLRALPRPLDVVVLGMGGDGHTASFFAGGDHLGQALDPAATALVLPMRAPAAGEARITLSLPPIASARHPYLHVEGAEKLRVLAAAVAGTGAGRAYPIRRVLEQTQAPMQVFCTA